MSNDHTPHEDTTKNPESSSAVKNASRKRTKSSPRKRRNPVDVSEKPSVATTPSSPWVSTGPALYALTFVVMVVGYFLYHGKQSPSPAPSPDVVEVSDLDTKIAAEFPSDKDTDALEYAAYFAACRDVIRMDGIMIPEAVVVHTQKVRNLPSISADFDKLVEKEMTPLAEAGVPDSGKLTEAQKTQVMETFDRLSKACFAASED